MYKDSVEELGVALARFRGVRRFSLYKTDNVRSYLYRDFYDLALAKVTQEFPALHSLAFHSDEHSLDFLKHLQYLRQLRFTGHSKSTPMETLNILSRLRHLAGIELIRSIRPKVHDGLDVDLSGPNSVSLTREVIRELRGLKIFAIEERSNHNGSPAFFTPGFLQTLASSQRISLQRMSVSLDFVPVLSAQHSFGAFLAVSSIKHLEILWPRLDADLMEFLPRSIETLRVPLSSHRSPYSRPPHWILLKLQSKRRDLPSFRKAYLMADSRSEQVCTMMWAIEMGDS